MRSVADDLRALLAVAVPRLAGIDDAQAARAPAPGRWSAKQVLGHLVDSASNNQGRFVRAQLGEDLVFEPYEQDEWVELQGYADAPWGELLALWNGLNLQLARVIERIPGTVATRPRARHNLDRIAWRPHPADRPATLGWFVEDYVGHLRHHLLPLLGALPEDGDPGS